MSGWSLRSKFQFAVALLQLPIVDLYSCKAVCQLRIGSCLACVYRVMDARGKFGEHERGVRVARGDSREQL